MAELESLFLLELLVDCVTFTTEEALHLKETCVRFQFLQFPPFDVCEEDFAPNADGYEPSDVPFNGGKSILFSMSQYKAGNNVNLYVTVTRSDESGKKIEIGTTVVPLGSSFTNLFSCTNKQPLAEPVAKTIRDTYNFCNNKNVTTGRVSLLVRLSCFGCAIVTQFEVTDPEEPSFKFKNEEYKASSACIKVSPGQRAISAPSGIGQDGAGGQEYVDTQRQEYGYRQQYYAPHSAPLPNQNAPPPAYFRPPVYSAPPPNVYPYPNQFFAGQYSQNMAYPQYPSPMFSPQYPQYQTQERPQQVQEIPQMSKSGLMCTCDNTKGRPESPTKQTFRRCYVLGEGIGPLPRTGDVFSWNLPPKTEKDKERENLLGPNIAWEISPTHTLRRGDLIQIDVTSAGPKKGKPSKADGKKKLGMKGRGKGKLPKGAGTAVVPLDRDKIATQKDKSEGQGQAAGKKKKKGKGKNVKKQVGVNIKRTSKTETRKYQVNTMNVDELKEQRALSEERIKEMRKLDK